MRCLRKVLRITISIPAYPYCTTVFITEDRQKDPIITDILKHVLNYGFLVSLEVNYFMCLLKAIFRYLSASLLVLI